MSNDRRSERTNREDFDIRICYVILPLTLSIVVVSRLSYRGRGLNLERQKMKTRILTHLKLRHRYHS
jgi:hypothetical protein